MILTLHFHPLLQPMTGVKYHTFEVSALSDIKSALCVLFPKIRKYIKQITAGILKENLSLITVDGKILTRKDYYIDKINNKELTLVPIIAGAGGKGFSLILGIILIAAAFYTGGGSLAGLTSEGGGAAAGGFDAAKFIIGGKGSFFSLTAGGLMKMGIGLAISGLMQMLMKPPSLGGATTDSSTRRNNDMFDAFDNSTSSETAIPLIYGMPRVAGQILSGHIETIQHGQTANITVSDLIYKNRSQFTSTEEFKEESKN